MKTTGLPILLLALAAGGAVGCQPAVPANPSYAADVHPIFLSHCVRCHGAGGTLNQARDPQGGADAGPLASAGGTPNQAYLGQYEDSGDCSGDDNPTPPCHLGAHTMATSKQLQFYLHDDALPMPPPPAPRLDDWELKVVDAWTANPIP